MTVRHLVILLSFLLMGLSASASDRTGVSSFISSIHYYQAPDEAYESVLSQIVQETNVNFAILQGTISKIKDTPYGQLIVSFEGEASNIDTTIQKLRERDLDVEVMES